MFREEVLPALAMSKTAVYGVLSEKRPITVEMAVRIGKLCGNGPRFRANLQRAYDPAHAERAVDVSRIPTLAARPG